MFEPLRCVYSGCNVWFGKSCISTRNEWFNFWYATFLLFTSGSTTSHQRSTSLVSNRTTSTAPIAFQSPHNHDRLVVRVPQPLCRVAVPTMPSFHNNNVEVTNADRSFAKSEMTQLDLIGAPSSAHYSRARTSIGRVTSTRIKAVLTTRHDMTTASHQMSACVYPR